MKIAYRNLKKIKILFFILYVMLFFGLLYYGFSVARGAISKNRKESVIDFNVAKWEGIKRKWDTHASLLIKQDLEPNRFFEMASQHKIQISSFQILEKDLGYYFHAKGELNNLMSFIKSLEKLLDWHLQSFHSSSQQDTLFLKNVFFIKRFKKTEKLNQLNDKMCLKKIEELESFAFYSKNNQTENLSKILSKHSLKTEVFTKKYSKNRKEKCFIPHFKINALVAQKIVQIKDKQGLYYYKIGDFIGDYQIVNVSTRGLRLKCGKDSLEIYMKESL